MRHVFGFVIALAALAFAACGGDGGECAEPAADVTGEWKIDATPVTDTCGGSLAPETFFITAVQKGNAVTSETPEGPMTGTICGDQLRLSGSWAEAGVAQTVNLELTVSMDGNSAEGSDTWTWTEGGQTCGGSELLKGTRVDGQCAAPVDVAGDWVMTSTVVSDNCDGRESQTFPMAITQEANALTVETTELTFSGTICGNQIEMSGSFAEDEGTVTVDATLTVSADGHSMEGSDTWTWTDGVESCSGSDSLSATATCDTIFGDAEEYILCEETESTCKFYVVLNNSSCTQLCASFDATCLDAIQDDNDACAERAPGSCDDVVGDRICVCSKSSGG